MVHRWDEVGAPLEYWFVRTSWPGGALLVDVIVRRVPGTVEVRVVSSPDGRGRVDRVVEPMRVSGGPAAAGCEITMTATHGSVESVAWDLALEVGPERIAVPPSLIARTKAFDLSLVSFPDVTVTGTVMIDEVEHHLVKCPGMACHYWARRLPRRWVWVSASDFDRPNTAVEAGVLESSVWGRRLGLPPTGYAWLRAGALQRSVVSPLNGVVRRYGSPDRPEVRLTAHGTTSWTIHTWAPPESFVDLGEGILQSLRADCTVATGRGEATAHGTAVLEFRELPLI